jgi:hypothetical protein
VSVVAAAVISTGRVVQFSALSIGRNRLDTWRFVGGSWRKDIGADTARVSHLRTVPLNAAVPTPRQRVVRTLASLAMAANLAGCETVLTATTPSPDRPEMVSARLETDRVRSGCPVRLRLSFRDAGRNVTRALASWTYEGQAEVGIKPLPVEQSGFAAVPLDPSVLTRRRQGDAEITLTPLQPGQYRYSVQVEDVAGNRSNVVEESFTVLPQPIGAPVSCQEPVR